MKSYIVNSLKRLERLNSITKMGWLSQPIFYVVQDVVAVFEAYGDADETGRDADGSAFLFRELGMGRAGWVGGDAAGVAEVGGKRQHFEPIEEFAARLETAGELETDDAAAVLHLTFRDLVLRVAGQKRIAHR